MKLKFLFYGSSTSPSIKRTGDRLHHGSSTPRAPYPGECKSHARALCTPLQLGLPNVAAVGVRPDPLRCGLLTLTSTEALLYTRAQDAAGTFWARFRF